MMGAKRGNDSSQVSKEDYDKAQNDDGDVNYNNQISHNVFERADASTLAQRRIINVRNPSSATSGTANALHKAATASVSNPFATVNLTPAKPSSMTTTIPTFSFGGSTNNRNVPTATETPQKPPFQFGVTHATTISLDIKNNFSTSSAETSASTTKPPLFSFGSSTTSVATTANIPTSAFAASTANSLSASRTITKHDWKYAKATEEAETALINKIGSWQSIQELDMTATCKNFLCLIREFGKSFGKEGGNTTDSLPTVTSNPLNSATISSSNAPAPTMPSFSFGAPSSKPSNTPSNVIGTTDKNSLYSSWKSSSLPSNTIETNTNAATMHSVEHNEDDGVVDSEPSIQVEKVHDPDWESLKITDKVRFYRLIDPKSPQTSSWVSFAFGKLDIQKSTKISSTYRMVLRAEYTGKPLVNMKIMKNVTFSLMEEKNKNGVITGKISFSGINSSERGNEGFIIKAKIDAAKSLHQKLSELSKLAN